MNLKDIIKQTSAVVGVTAIIGLALYWQIQSWSSFRSYSPPPQRTAKAPPLKSVKTPTTTLTAGSYARQPVFGNTPVAINTPVPISPTPPYIPIASPTIAQAPVPSSTPFQTIDTYDDKPRTDYDSDPSIFWIPTSTVIPTSVPMPSGTPTNTPAVSRTQTPSLERIVSQEFPDILYQVTSNYAIVSPERLYNIELAANRLNGAVIDTGETFSFNSAVGEISIRNGYQLVNMQMFDSASDLTGVTQVVTSLFQAAFMSGMKIEERNWFTYWISRYELKQSGMVGLDASVNQEYSNGKLIRSSDLRWKNITPHQIPIRANTDGRNLVVSLVGKETGYNVGVSKPIISNIIDFNGHPSKELKPGNGFDIEFTRTVTSPDGIVLSRQLFKSRYLPSSNPYVLDPR